MKKAKSENQIPKSNYSTRAFSPSPMSAKYQNEHRTFQGIPSLEVLASGKILVTWYANNREIHGEGKGNYVILCQSNDHGLSWRETHVVAPAINADERAFDAVLWQDPVGRVWWIWSQSYSEKLGDIFDGRAGVWCSRCDRPDAEVLQWSPPRRLGDGVMMCKPSVLSDGAWVFPVALWALYPEKQTPDERKIARSNLLISRDQGESFTFILGPDISHRTFDEHILIENTTNDWTLYIRTTYGIGCSRTRNGGQSWSKGKDSRLGGAGSRVAIRKLKSGNLLLVNNESPHRLPGQYKACAVREKMTAFLSKDNGKSWSVGLRLDERSNVSYPDIAEGNDGFIYITYDRDRYQIGQILLSRFTEADIEAGALITPGSYGYLSVNGLNQANHKKEKK